MSREREREIGKEKYNGRTDKERVVFQSNIY